MTVRTPGFILLLMTNAQLKAIRDLAHAQHDAGAANVVAIIRTDRGFEVRKGGKTVDIATTWEGANELASFL